MGSEDGAIIACGEMRPSGKEAGEDERKRENKTDAVFQ